MKFVVLPDTPDAAAVLERIPSGERVRSLSHASGRPWIVGSWNEDEVVTGDCGTSRIALFGTALTTPSRLDRALAGRGGLSALDTVARSVPGSYHMLVSIDGVTRVQGSLSGVHEVSWTTVDGVALAADRPDTLAALTGYVIDDTSLVGHFMGHQPWPLNARTVWRAVEHLKLGEYLRLDIDGTARAVRWWTPPPAELPLAEAAEQVRDALRNAVAARAASSLPLGCDLSGGTDSTSLAFLLDRLRPRAGMVTVSKGAEDPANDDVQWASQAGSLLSHSEQLVLEAARYPMMFADQLSLEDDLERPYAWSKTKSRTVHVARLLADRGMSVQLTGHGGDELFYPAPSAYHSLIRRHPLRSIPAARSARSLFRWPVGAMVGNLLRNPSYGRWLATACRDVTQPTGSPRDPLAAWGPFPSLPSWVTTDAVDACRSALRAAVRDGTAPHSSDPSQHGILDAVRTCGRPIRLTHRLTSRHGVGYHAPFLDDQVVEASLAARLLDRFDPQYSKPVLVEAMRGIVPDAILGRATKGEFSSDVYAGVRRHKQDLLELCDGMRLAERGLVDEEAVRKVLMAPHPMPRTFIPMVHTLACESWLRSVEAARGERRRSKEGVRA